MHRSLRCPWVPLAAVLLLSSSSPAAAGPGLWTSYGPEGGNVTSLVAGAGSGVFFACVSGGVVKSGDGGRTWHRVLTDPSGPGMGSLTVHPVDPGTLYYAGGEGLYRTTDSGATWSRVSFDPGKIVISRAAPRTIWAAGREPLVSHAAGVSWAATAGWYAVAQPPRDLAADPARAGVVYASTSAGLFKTVDGGDHWTLILGNDPSQLAIDPNHPETIYASAFTRFYEGVLRSTDGGATWTRLTIQGQEPYVAALAVDPVSSAVYAAATMSAPHGAFKSLDGGDTWIDLGATLPSMMPYGFAFDPRRPWIVYLTGSSGVWRSVDRGRSWAASSGGIPAGITAVAFAPSDPRIVYAGSGNGDFFQSADRGKTWSRLFPRGLNGTGISGFSGLRVDPRSPATLYATTDWGLWRSLDGGWTWRRLGSQLGFMENVYDLALDPLAPDTLYGATWTGAIRSTDGGETWSLIWSQPPGSSSWVYHVAVSASRPAEVYIASSSGLFASPDRGQTWTRLLDSIEEFSQVAVDPALPSVLYLRGERSLSRSTDGGRTWAPIDDDISYPKPMADLVIDPAHPEIVYCATWYGVYRSLDRGTTWRRMGRPFGDSMVLDLALGPKILFVATTAGIFEWSPIFPR